MVGKLRRLIRSVRGATAIEYALLGSFISIMVFSTVAALSLQS